MTRFARVRAAVVAASMAALAVGGLGHASATPMTPQSAQGRTADCPTLSVGDSGQAVKELQYRLASYGYVLAVDGDFGPITDKAVRHFQRSSGLLDDGIVGPITNKAMQCGHVAPSQPLSVPVGISGSGQDVAAQALRAVGATEDEVAFGIRICQRESRCTLGAVNQNSNTHDDSWGPWQINYYGSLSAREHTIGSRSSNVASWEQAATNFLTLLRASGRCHWTPPNYCS